MGSALAPLGATRIGRYGVVYQNPETMKDTKVGNQSVRSIADPLVNDDPY